MRWLLDRPVKPGDDSREMGRLIFIPLNPNPSQSV
jgi:hypothetical protein